MSLTKAHVLKGREPTIVPWEYRLSRKVGSVHVGHRASREADGTNTKNPK